VPIHGERRERLDLVLTEREIDRVIVDVIATHAVDYVQVSVALRRIVLAIRRGAIWSSGLYG